MFKDVPENLVFHIKDDDEDNLVDATAIYV